MKTLKLRRNAFPGMFMLLLILLPAGMEINIQSSGKTNYFLPMMNRIQLLREFSIYKYDVCNNSKERI